MTAKSRASANPPAPISSDSRLWICVAVLAAVILAAYFNTFRVPLILDDVRCIEGNSSIRQLNALGTVLSPPPDSQLGARPLSNLSFALNYAWGGTGVVGYHVVNLILHIAAACTLFGLVRRTWLRFRPAGAAAESEASATIPALLIAAIWAVHPLLTSAVTYLSQRTEVLMGLCYLGALYAFTRGAEPARRGWLVVSVAICACGMLAKEVMVTAPLAVWWYDRTFVSSGYGEALRRRKGYYAALAGCWVLLFVVMHRGLESTVGLSKGVSAWEYAVMECHAHAAYLMRAIWPHPLIFDYGETVPATIASALPVVWAPLILVAGLVYGIVRRSAVGFALGWIALTLAPTSSVIPVTLQPIGENRTYLALAGLVTLVVLGLRWKFGTRGLWVAAALGLTGLVLTIQRNGDFRDPVTLWTDTVRHRPENPRAQSNLGQALHVAGRLTEAENHYREALRLKPGFAIAHDNYAKLLFAQGRYAEAAEQAQEATRLAPQLSSAYTNLGVALLMLGRATEGIAQLEAALRIEPGLVYAHRNLALALANGGQFEAALPHFKFTIQAGGGDALVHFRFGGALLSLSRRSEAVEQFRLSLQLQPGQPEVLAFMGEALSQDGRIEEAIKAFEEALRLKPDYGAVRERLQRLQTTSRPVR